MFEAEPDPKRIQAIERIEARIFHLERVIDFIPNQADLSTYGKIRDDDPKELNFILERAKKTLSDDELPKYIEGLHCVIAVLRKQQLRQETNLIYIDELREVAHAHMDHSPYHHSLGLAQQIIYDLSNFGLIEYGGPDYGQVILTFDKAAADNLL